MVSVAANYVDNAYICDINLRRCNFILYVQSRVSRYLALVGMETSDLTDTPLTVIRYRMDINSFDG